MKKGKLEISDESAANIPEDEEETKKLLMQDDKQPLISSTSSCGTKVYKRRWLILFIFSMNTAASGALFMGLSSISDLTSKYYGVSTVLIEWLSNMFLLLYVFFALPSAYIVSKWGVRPVIFAAAALDTAATALHYAGHRQSSFHFVIVGQLFAAIAFGSILQLPGKISAVWFPENERATATSIGVFMNILGVALGFLQPTHMVEDSINNKVVENGIRKLFLSQLIVCFFILVLTTVFYKEEPPTPPSLAHDEPDVGFAESLKMLVKDKYFIIMSQAYAVYYGLFVTLSVIISPLITAQFPYGYESKIGWMGFTWDAAGILSCFIIGLWLDKYHGHQAIAVLLNVCSVITWLAFILILTRTKHFVGLFIMFGILGLVGVPYFAAGIEQAAEMTYPVPEQTSSAVILILGNLYGFIFILSIGTLVQLQYVQLVGFIILGLYSLSTILACFTKTELKRKMAEYEAATCLPDGSRDDIGKGWVNIRFIKSAN